MNAHEGDPHGQGGVTLLRCSFENRCTSAKRKSRSGSNLCKFKNIFRESDSKEVTDEITSYTPIPPKVQNRERIVLQSKDGNLNFSKIRKK